MQVSKQKFVIWQVYNAIFAICKYIQNAVLRLPNRGKSSLSLFRAVCRAASLRASSSRAWRRPPSYIKITPALPQMTEWGNSLVPFIIANLCGLYADLSFNEVQRNSQARINRVKYPNFREAVFNQSRQSGRTGLIPFRFMLGMCERVGQEIEPFRQLVNGLPGAVDNPK